MSSEPGHVCTEDCLHDCPECDHEVDHTGAFHAPWCASDEADAIDHSAFFGITPVGD